MTITCGVNSEIGSFLYLYPQCDSVRQCIMLTCCMHSDLLIDHHLSFVKVTTTGYAAVCYEGCSSVPSLL